MGALRELVAVAGILKNAQSCSDGVNLDNLSSPVVVEDKTTNKLVNYLFHCDWNNRQLDYSIDSVVHIEESKIFSWIGIALLIMVYPLNQAPIIPPAIITII
jgi:hypothetical protein